MEEKATDSLIPEANSGDGLFASNALRLTPKQWAVTVLLLAAVYIALPRLWIYAEPFSADANYRIPYSLSDDYWLYHRYAGEIASADRIPLIGDSVIWGQYVVAEDSLSHFLNESFGEDRFANMGVNGTHPVALAGLVRHYGQAIRNRKVVLHLNPLWLSSKRHDLRDERARRFNHPDLVPQFYPEIPSYNAPFAVRLAVLVERESAFLSWTDHVRIAYYGNKAVPLWTMDSPYESPLAPLTGVLPKDGDRPPSDPIPWENRDMRPQDFDWVPLKESLQWQFFQDTVETLETRGNEVFVILGPFNEHMLTPASRVTYRERRDEMVAWIAGRNIPFVAPEPLPTKLYADASHPIAAGYIRLADELLADPGFRSFAENR
jgi:hypothetical protein